MNEQKQFSWKERGKENQFLALQDILQFLTTE